MEPFGIFSICFFGGDRLVFVAGFVPLISSLRCDLEALSIECSMTEHYFGLCGFYSYCD